MSDLKDRILAMLNDVREAVVEANGPIPMDGIDVFIKLDVLHPEGHTCDNCEFTVKLIDRPPVTDAPR